MFLYMIFTRLHKGNTWRNIMGAGGVYRGTSTKNLEDMTPEEKAEYLKQKQQLINMKIHLILHKDMH